MFLLNDGVAIEKNHFFVLNSLSSGPKATTALALPTLPLTTAKASYSRFSLTFSFSERSYLLKDDLLKPNEQSRKCKKPQNVLFHLQNLHSKIDAFRERLLLKYSKYIPVCFPRNKNFSLAYHNCKGSSKSWAK